MNYFIVTVLFLSKEGVRISTTAGDSSSVTQTRMNDSRAHLGNEEYVLVATSHLFYASTEKLLTFYTRVIRLM